jgi:hypothetical protein
MHLLLDRLNGVLMPLQPVVADRTGVTLRTVGLLVALALVSPSLRQRAISNLPLP